MEPSIWMEIAGSSPWQMECYHWDRPSCLYRDRVPISSKFKVWLATRMDVRYRGNRTSLSGIKQSAGWSRAYHSSFIDSYPKTHFHQAQQNHSALIIITTCWSLACSLLKTNFLLVRGSRAWGIDSSWIARKVHQYGVGKRALLSARDR